MKETISSIQNKLDHLYNRTQVRGLKPSCKITSTACTSFYFLGGYLHTQGPWPDAAQHKQPPGEWRRKWTGWRLAGRRSSAEHSQRGDPHWAGEKSVPVLLSLPGEEHTGKCAAPKRKATYFLCLSCFVSSIAHETFLVTRFTSHVFQDSILLTT